MKTKIDRIHEFLKDLTRLTRKHKIMIDSEWSHLGAPFLRERTAEDRDKEYTLDYGEFLRLDKINRKRKK